MPHTITLDDATYAALVAALQVPATVVTTPPATTPPPITAAVSYPLSQATLVDGYFLNKMDGTYRKTGLGTGQVFYDLLTVNGKLWSQLTGAAQQSAQGALNRFLNSVVEDNSATAVGFDVKSYTGPLLAVYKAFLAFHGVVFAYPAPTTLRGA